MIFLERVAKQIISENQNSFEDVAVVFPSRRAGLFFKRELGKQIGKPFFAPEVFSIEDFASKVANLFPTERLKLIFEMFKVYKKFFGEETFDNFYNWGNILLKDFDDLDKNLVNPEKFFRIIKEYKEIDDNFAAELEDYDSYISFWQTFSNEPITSHKQSFKELWEKLNSIYNEFVSVLRSKKTGYNGMIFREAVNKIRQKDFISGYEKIYFAGFNYLSKSESEILSTLQTNENALILWNADEYYTEKIPGHEAGRLLNKNFKKFERDKNDIRWITNDFANEKNISVYSSSTNIAQAKTVSQILSGVKNPSVDTAIILPDESLLFPILNSLPENVKRINVSMGYPLKLSTFHSLIEAYIRLHSNMKSDSGGEKFYFKDVFRILSSPIVTPSYIYNEENSVKISDFRKKVFEQKTIYIKSSDLPQKIKMLDIIFRRVESVDSLFSNIEELVLEISVADKKHISKFELEFIMNYLQFLRQLRGTLIEYGTNIDLKTFWKLYMDVIRESRLPFKGEPLEGVQILGLLETRNLSFENVIIISLNEKIIPGNRFSESFIPFNLRKSFGISTFEDYQDSTSNYFYNIIKDAKNVHLIHTNDMSEKGDGEQSRYIAQMEMELPQYNPETKIKKLSVDFPAKANTDTEISVQKDVAMFKDFLERNRVLSPSALNYYVNCSLKFYFAYILKLREPEDPIEEIDGKTLGIILHKVMELLYNDFTGREVTSSDVEELIRKSPVVVESVMRNDPFYIRDLNTGSNLITKKIIQRLVKRLLYSDKEYAPFKIISLETESDKYKIETEISESRDLALGGRIDRVDEKNGVIRIVDYKTGALGNTKSDIEIEQLFKDPKFKELLQTFLYTYMYIKSTGAKDVTATLLSLKNKGELVGNVIAQPFSNEQISDFEKELTVLLNEILNTDIPFQQTDDLKRCEYCPYISICGR